MSKQEGASNTLRDLSIYILIGLVVVGLAMLEVWHVVRSGKELQFPLGWIWWTVETAMVFGYIVKAFQHFWRRRKFWLVFAGLLCIHIVASTVALTRLQDKLPLLLLSFAIPLEYFLVSFIILAVVERK